MNPFTHGQKRHFRCLLKVLALSPLFLASPVHSESTDPLPLKGSFSLKDEQGTTRKLEDYRGSYLLVYFGYTYCPDVCPTNLGIIAQVLNTLPTGVGDHLTPLFVSVDPERDTPAQLGDYTDAFHPRLIGLTGTAEEVRQAANTFGVYYARVENPADRGHYLVDHSSSTYFIDDQGRLRDIFEHAMAPEDMRRRIVKEIQP
ncbi:MAG: SCO family protein [Magnetococcales bacterium]|nr:SCO family protein [Magnetococcales bacterium]